MNVFKLQGVAASSRVWHIEWRPSISFATGTIDASATARQNGVNPAYIKNIFMYYSLAEILSVRNGNDAQGMHHTLSSENGDAPFDSSSSQIP